MTTAPTWLTDLIELVMDHVDAYGAGTFGYRYRQEEEDDSWEIMLYPTPVELQGGSADGEWVLLCLRVKDFRKINCNTFTFNRFTME